MNVQKFRSQEDVKKRDEVGNRQIYRKWSTLDVISAKSFVDCRNKVNLMTRKVSKVDRQIRFSWEWLDLYRSFRDSRYIR